MNKMTNNEKALMLHEKWHGKLETVSKCAIRTREDLALAYTPGVAEPCKVIAKDKEQAYKYTIKSNTVAVVSDGSAVLGLGNIGPYAAMPVMEGKAVLFKEFGNVNAVPICLDTQDTEEIIKTVRIFQLQGVLKLRKDLKHYLIYLFSMMTSTVPQLLFWQVSLMPLKLQARKKKNVKSLSMVRVPQALQSQSFCLHMVLNILPCVTNQVFFPLTLKVLTGCRKK